jgi:hypothetical protein
MTLSATAVGQCDNLTASVTLTNTGNLTGAEVAQLYVSIPSKAMRAVRPLWQLAGLIRTPALAPGASTRLSFAINARALSVVYADGRRYVERGEAILREWLRPPHLIGANALRAAIACHALLLQQDYLPTLCHVYASLGAKHAPQGSVALRRSVKRRRRCRWRHSSCTGPTRKSSSIARSRLPDGSSEPEQAGDQVGRS